MTDQTVTPTPTTTAERIARSAWAEWRGGRPEDAPAFWLADTIEAIAAAIQAEREECAKVAEGYRLHEPDRVCCMGRNERIAAAIRART